MQRSPLTIGAVIAVLFFVAVSSFSSASGSSINNKKKTTRAAPKNHFHLLNATQPSWQLDSNRMLFASQKPTANWPTIPIQKGVDSIVFDTSSKRYVALADGCTQIWSAAEDDLSSPTASKTAWRLASGTAFLPKKNSSQQMKFVAAALTPSQCLSPTLTPGACSSSPSSASSSSSIMFVASGIIAVCSFNNNNDLVCMTAVVRGAIAPPFPFECINNVAVSAAPVADSKTQAAVLVATTAGLANLVADPSGNSFTARFITMKNTTGSLVQNGNTTFVTCLPPAHYDHVKKQATIRGDRDNNGDAAFLLHSLHQKHNKKNLKTSSSSFSSSFSATAGVTFFGADCFATTSENYCTSNVCPADLVHNIKAANATSVAIVTPYSFVRIPGVIDARPTAAVYTPQSRHLMFGNKMCVNSLHHTSTLRRYGGFHGGLPANNILSGAWLNLSYAHSQMKALGGGGVEEHELDGVAVFGTARGMIAKLPSKSDDIDAEGKQWNEKGDQWKLLLGSRWLPGVAGDGKLQIGQRVTAMASGTRSVLAVSDTGLALISALVQRPADRAASIEKNISPLLQRSWGAFADTPLKKWGDASSAESDYSENGNFGLWTGMRVASCAMRYVASGNTDEEARQQAWTAFGGLETLVNVTGIRGYFARAAKQTNTRPNGWHKSPSMPGWFFVGNSSSDEATGHWAGYTAMYFLVCKTDAEKARVAKLFDTVMSHLVDHHLTLIGWHGLPTMWGHWSPKALIDSPFWYDDHLNCIEILGALSSIYQITKNETYRQVFDDLVDNHGYDVAMLNAKITQPTDDNFSDDELLFMAYFTLAISGRTGTTAGAQQQNPLFERVAPFAAESMYRSWKTIKYYKPSLWAVFYAAFHPIFDTQHQHEHRHAQEHQDVKSALWRRMVTQPIEFVDWPVDNSQRLNNVWNPHDSRGGNPHVNLENLFPLDELTAQTEWNWDPFNARQGSGATLSNTIVFLFPYWTAMAAQNLQQGYPHLS